MSRSVEKTEKIPEKFDDNLVLFLCRGQDRKKVRFRKRDVVPQFKQEVLQMHFIVFIRFILLINSIVKVLSTVRLETKMISSGEILKMKERGHLGKKFNE